MEILCFYYLTVYNHWCFCLFMILILIELNVLLINNVTIIKMIVC